MTETALPAWQHGYPIEELREVAAIFKAADGPHVLGAFTGFKERDVAQARADGMLIVGQGERAAVVVREVRQRQAVKDFTGHVRARMEPGDLHISRLGCLPGAEQDLRGLLAAVAARVPREGALFVSIWQESGMLRRLLANLPGHADCVAVKIPASSEIIGVYALSRSGRKVERVSMPQAETWGLRRLTDGFAVPILDAAREALDRLPAWADHYSSYNKGHTWSALALRGYGGPDCIVKPSEMSKGWKRENPGMLEAVCRDTPLRADLPELEPLIGAIPGEHQRIRLMRLQPGGGELTRHADITDPEAGTGRGKLLRIHLPLVTNEDVLFSSWDLNGRKSTRHMAVGEAWYLDTRKPHTAINGGSTPRVHLVVDAYSTPDLLDMLRQGADK